MSDHHVNIFWSGEDGCYVADIPALDACSESGETPQEALAEVLEAKRAWLEVARERGVPIPPLTCRPAAAGTSQ